MKYMLMFYESAEDFAARTDDERQGAYWGAWQAYSDAMSEATGDYSGACLQGVETATIVRGAADARQVQDGPFADTKEQLGGYFLVDLPSLDDALDWAARCPAAKNGAVEVRPILPMS